ncbi:MAG: DUF1667 domain-containing protein [Xylanivirga thermophila]|jgi:CxxC motif-containing protein|uniref:DUF1667 domain-containing protein n=1 Tax=Xylanivirga thermophila TaxID=2496273 RepID=UPI00101C01C9|nr:DUF1667 domain-containing protein [Xylanivirga thermophila]
MMKLVCILCPRGCNLIVDKTGEEWNVKGNGCKRGVQYAIQEATCPMRTVTTSMWIDGGDYKLISVKTDKPIPKERIGEVLDEISRKNVYAPIDIGDVLIYNVADTDANIVATRRVCAV